MQDTNKETLSDSVLEQIAVIAGKYKENPENLMRILFEIQELTNNSIGQKATAVISKVTGIPEAKLYGYMTFYAMFSEKPRGKYLIRMCKSAPCHVRGAKEVIAAFEKELGIKTGETTEDKMFTLEYCECIGMCDISPAVMINDKVYGNLTPEKAKELVEKYRKGDVE